MDFILNYFLARCISLLVEFADVVDFSISLDNGDTYRSLGQYTYMALPLNFVADVQVRNTSNLLLNDIISWKQVITLDWFLSLSTFDSLPSNSTLTIEYVQIAVLLLIKLVQLGGNCRFHQERR